MVRDPGPCHVRDIHAKIEPLGLHRLGKHFHYFLQNLEKFLLFLRVHPGQTSDVPFRNDHKMTIIVRIAVEDHRMVGRPEKDKISLISFIPEKRTKKTARAFTGARAQVGLAPRSPHEVGGSLEVHGFLGVMAK
jgi:hypothetical protein